MGAPQAKDEDPPAEALRAVKHSYEWINTWRYVIVQPSVKAVGLAAASFANKDGTSVRPGVRRLMTITGYSNRAVVDALATLRWLGFLWRTKAAVRTPEGGQADEYQLCLPRDMSRVPIADFETGTEPAFDDLKPETQIVAETLGVAKRLRKVSSELSSASSEVSSLERVTSVHNTNPPTNTNNHSAEQQAGPRASSHAADDHYRAFVARELRDRVAPGETLTAADEEQLFYDIGYDYVVQALGDLDAFEESTVLGMLYNEHACKVVNTILDRRRNAA